MGTIIPRCLMLITLVFIGLILSPGFQEGVAARSNVYREVLVRRPICPACVCCQPPPPGSCCSCCASPINSQSNNGSP
ncbi:hypothetical protein KY290_019260 [Solanum tuberosum]|uniref:Uncharacterized protein n=2 Tax=Solanum tuberosum TaxID=4113 RepID=A0ABQ7VGJ5_SOLTU|nr:hypothetical protein KY284_018212 [Solanum tuberosum]KAH0703939.1 hypothetical protein KY285_018217 [Solanum tuberosum]KAH0763187.1 hypothetical protein KY290_019260 [Solanum tuberosum]